MKLDLLLEETYPHPIERVWKALTDPAALAAWMRMVNDFEPHIGKRFTFRSDPNPGFRGWIDCEVIELEPPNHMVWSWLSADEGIPTRVKFQLEPVGASTRLTFSHTGEVDPEIVARLKSGWTLRLGLLGKQIKPL